MSKIETNKIDSISGTSTLTLGDTNATTLDFDTGITSVTNIPKKLNNTPTFYAYLSADQDISTNTYTKVQFNTELFDADGVYDNSTNYRFTPGVAGKYYVFTQVQCQSTDSNSDFSEVWFYLNGTGNNRELMNANGTSNAQFNHFPHHLGVIMDLSATDYIEVYTRIGGSQAGGTRIFGNSNKQTYFEAYKLIE